MFVQELCAQELDYFLSTLICKESCFSLQILPCLYHRNCIIHATGTFYDSLTSKADHN